MKTNSGQLRSRFPSSFSKKTGKKLSHSFRGGVKSKNKTIYASSESKHTVERIDSARQMLADEKQKAAKERAEKELLRRAVEAKPSSHRGGLKRDSVGYYIQPRVNGKFQAKVYLAK